MPPFQYVIDTSALLDLAKQYPGRIFPGVWDGFGEMCDQRLIIAPREVYREILKGDDELVEWAKNKEHMFLEPCEEELAIVQDLMKGYPLPVISKYSTRPWADPLVIACAKHYKLSIIQHEVSDPNQHKIPAIARKHGIKCQRLVDFFDDVRWVFE